MTGRRQAFQAIQAVTPLKRPGMRAVPVPGARQRTVFPCRNRAAPRGSEPGTTFPAHSRPRLRGGRLQRGSSATGSVMPALVAGIHAFTRANRRRGMAGIKPAMTKTGTPSFFSPYAAAFLPERRPKGIKEESGEGARMTSLRIIAVVCATIAGSDRLMRIVRRSTGSRSSTPMTWLAATASITRVSCGIADRRAPLPRTLRWDATPKLAQGECGCSRRRTVAT